MVRNWKREFLEKACTVFEAPRKEAKQARKEEAQRKEVTRMLKTIEQLMFTIFLICGLDKGAIICYMRLS